MSVTKTNTNSLLKGLQVIFALALTAVFFLAWAGWSGNSMKGSDFPSGHFFDVSDKKFNLANPFPQFAFVNAVFWLIPAMGIIALLIALGNKKQALPAIIAGFLTLCLATVFILFTDILVMLGGVADVLHSLKPALFIAVVTGVGIILAFTTHLSWIKRILLVITGPLLTAGAFYVLQKTVEAEGFDDTAKLKADYTVNATEFINEFVKNDTASNNKYREKIITVNGNASEIAATDSTATIKFADSTGSYVIFSFDKDHVAAVKKVKEGDAVSIKGSCSGGVYSDILETESITFKRCVLNK